MPIPTTLSMSKAYQNILLEEAKTNGILKTSRTMRPRLQERLFMRVGDLLISAGLRLQGRFELATLPCSKVYQSGC